MGARPPLKSVNGVFPDDDRVIDHDPDGHDKGDESHEIQRAPKNPPVNGQGQGEAHGDSRSNPAGAPGREEQQEHGEHEHRSPQGVLADDSELLREEGPNLRHHKELDPRGQGPLLALEEAAEHAARCNDVRLALP